MVEMEGGVVAFLHHHTHRHTYTYTPIHTTTISFMYGVYGVYGVYGDDFDTLHTRSILTLTLTLYYLVPFSILTF